MPGGGNIVEQPHKYQGLRTIGRIAQIAAWVVLAISILVTLWLFFIYKGFAGVWAGGQNWIGLAALAMGVSWFLQWFIIGGLLNLMTDLEENTRASVQAVERLVALSKEMSKASPPAPPSS